MALRDENQPQKQIGVYYCNGNMPTVADIAIARQHGITAYRNAKKIGDLEKNVSLVAGHVPAHIAVEAKKRDVKIGPKPADVKEVVAQKAADEARVQRR
jgi:hypothetical protein